MSSPTGEDTQDLSVDGQPWWNAAGGDPGASAEDRETPSFDGAAHELAGLPSQRPASGPPSAGLTRRGRPARAADPEALAPVRALAGAAVAVAGVALGIGTLLWASDSPDTADQGPVVRDAAQSVSAGGVEAPAVEQPSEQPVAEPTAAAPSAVPPPAVVESPAAPAPAPPPPAPAPAARPASVVVPITVLNNSRRSGLAARAAERFEDGGWPVRETGNYTGRLSETTLYFAPGQEASAQSFARTFRGIGRVLPRFDGLPGQGLTVVLTRDFPD